MAATSNLYSKVVRVSSDYLGPAADRFINRQIRNHLNIDPELLQSNELKSLIDWIKLSMTALTNDDKLVAEYIKSLNTLTKVKELKK